MTSGLPDSSFQQKRHRSVIHQVHLHISAKTSTGYLRMLYPSLLQQVVEQCFTLRRRRCGGKAGAQAAAGVRGESEL